MESLEKLFAFLFQHESTIVFTNLGRKPQLVFRHLVRDYFDVDIVVISQYYLFPTLSNSRIRTATYEDIPSLNCDLLFVIEPQPHLHITKPSSVGRLAILTSHLVFKHDPNAIYVSYFHFQTDLKDIIEKTKRLSSIQEGSVQTNNVNQVKVDHVRIIVFNGTSELGRHEEGSIYALIDLTKHSSKLKMYLQFWDAFDDLLRCSDRIDRWLTCFPEKSGIRVFEQFVQDVIDCLYCIRFEHGNVTDLKDILSFLPFYKSGIIDRKFEVKKERFSGIEYVAPATTLDLFKASTKYNLEHWVGSVYRIKE